MVSGNPRSTARLGNHPIHPMLVPFPIALLVATLVCDLIFWTTGSPGWATAALWVLGAGLLTAALAAIAGLTDFLGDVRIRALSDAWQHFIGNVIAVVLAVTSFIYRYVAGDAAVLPWGLVLSLIIVCILLFTGWKGGELVYRHRVAVMDETPQPSDKR